MPIGPRESAEKVRKRRRIGRWIARILRVLGATLRVRVDDPHRLLHTPPPHIIVIWHNRLAAAPVLYRKLTPPGRKNMAMISASGDGEILATVMQHFGIEAARGSSSRGGRGALLACLKALEQGYDVTVTPDGPRGPRYQPHAGIVKMAALSGVALYPLRVDYSRKWELKTWDRLQIPWPFSLATVRILEPLRVGADDDEQSVLAELLRRMGTD